MSDDLDGWRYCPPLGPLRSALDYDRRLILISYGYHSDTAHAMAMAGM